MRLGLTLDEIFERYSSSQIERWRALAIVDGWGDEDTRTARICAAVHNAIVSMMARTGVEVSSEDLATEEQFLPKFRWELPELHEATEDIRDYSRRVAGL